MQRQQVKQILRKIAEHAIKGVLGNVPRNLRRSAGRTFAREAYRYLNGLPKFDSRINDAVVRWVADEYTRLQSTSSKDSGANSSNNGSAAAAVANIISDGAVDGGELVSG